MSLMSLMCGSDPRPLGVARVHPFNSRAPNSQVEETSHIRGPGSNFPLLLVAGSHLELPTESSASPDMACLRLKLLWVPLVSVSHVQSHCPVRKRIWSFLYGSLFTAVYFKTQLGVSEDFPPWSPCAIWGSWTMPLTLLGLLGTDCILHVDQRLVFFPNWARPRSSFLSVSFLR